MATSATLSRASMPLARAAVSAVRRPSVRNLAAVAARRLDRAAGQVADSRHPLMPAAVRVERSRSRRGDRSAEQTAVTMWFGQGPALPGVHGGEGVRTAIRLGTGIVGAAALAAMTVIVARREEARSTIVDAAPPLSIS